MPLRLLMDECIQDKFLVAKLRAVGHDVLTVSEVGLTRKPDKTVFQWAIAEKRLILTINCGDFADLAEAQKGTYPGVLLVYRHNRLGKEMSNDAIVTAIANLEATNSELQNACHSLNVYDY